MGRRQERGASAPELLATVAIFVIIGSGLAVMLVRGLEVNKREQLRAEAQATARNCIARVVTTLRSAGWDPGNHGIPTVALDPDTTDAISEIEAFIDRDGDGFTSGAFEQVLFRHVGDRIEWRTDGTSAFEVMARNITNDANGDDTIEPMFTADSTTDPHRVVVQVTAEASAPDPVSREPIRYTLTSEVVLRKEL